MTIERKSCAPQIKRVGAGQATVVIATLNVRDKDGDVILPGFFGEQVVPVLPTHDWHATPIGKARVYELANEALADISFNLKTSGGKDWHEAILFDYEHPPAKQEYSFGFMIRQGASDFGDFAGEQSRFLKPTPEGLPGADMAEVSPVVRGAGQRTRTIDVKEENGGHETSEPPAGKSQVSGEETSSLGTDAKRLTLEQLLTLLDSQIEHLGFVQDMRAQKGKSLNPETIAMIDETSKRFDALRARVNLGLMERDSINEELEARYDRITANLSREETVLRSQEAAENENLEREAMARLERYSAVLHR